MAGSNPAISGIAQTDKAPGRLLAPDSICMIGSPLARFQGTDEWHGYGTEGAYVVNQKRFVTI